MSFQVSDGDVSESTAVVMSGTEFPSFTVQARDQWENPTAPCAEMPFNLVVESEALDPTENTFPFGPLANVTGKQLCKSITPILYTNDASNSFITLMRVLRISFVPLPCPANLYLLRCASGMKCSVLSSTESTAAVPVVCRLEFPGTSEESAREVLGGADLPRLDLGIKLLPSKAPASIRLMMSGEDIPLKVNYLFFSSC